MSGRTSLRWWASLWVALLVPALFGPATAGGADLANARLLIAGSRLTVSPESQTVPFDTPTIVETHLVGYDADRGTLPQDLRVVADFTGPEVDGILVLQTVPNQPFRIPRLRLEGEYRLDNIRLMQGADLLAYAEPRSAAVRVTQVLITRVTSRALTLDEIRSYGIVVNDDSFQAFNFTFAFAVAGETVNYNVPVIYAGPGKEQVILWDGLTNFEAPAWRASSTRFEPPRMAPFQLAFDDAGDRDNSFGGCEAADGDCGKTEMAPIPGVILFPTDVSLLHQFFSVVLLAQNGAPANDRLEIHDLTARVTLPPGLRQAQTQPPTPLGVPVPVRVPGPDGQLGTADDLTFLVAQATGQAEVLVEGLREGTHVVKFDLEGVLTGLADGQPRRVTGMAQGAVIVRDPTLNITITHPDTVRTDEEYNLLLTVTNTGTAPANLLKVKLPLDRVTGAVVVGENERTVTVLPGDSELLEFRLRSKRTGRVVASAARSSSAIVPTFDLTVGVGENGIPLSPTSIILPRATDSLPPDLLRAALNQIGLGFSLATAPPSLLRSDLPRVSRSMVDTRVYQLAQAGRHVSFGEDLFDSAAQLAAEWTGARDGDWEWDLLRRTTQKGARVGALLGSAFAAEAAATSPESAFDRFAKTTGYLPVLQGALATGSGVTLEVASRTGGQRVRGGGNDSARLRELPFADLFQLGAGAQMALLAVPEAGGYEARLRASSSVAAGLHVLVPGTDGGLRMVRWENVSLSAGGTAVAAFRAADSSFVLQVDTQGDGTVDDQVPPSSVETLQRRPFQAIAAVLNTEADPTGHVVDVLFSTDVDPASLSPGDPRHFEIAGKVSNGGWVQGETDVIDGSGNTVHNPFAGMRNTRIVRVVFNNPLSPYVPQDLTVAKVKNPLGEQVVSTIVRVRIPSNAMPGTLVEGKVFGPDGQPVPFAEVELREADRCLFCEEDCRSHKTAVVRADASGSFLFDYVRQTECSDIYQLKGTDSSTGRSGTATGRVRFIGQHTQLNVVMLGRGSIRGRVTYDDGSPVPAGARVIAESPVFREGVGAQLDDNGNYTVRDVPVGTITLSANDGQGRFVVKTVVVPESGSVVEHNLVILKRPDNPAATGEVRGTIYRPDGTTPVAGAYVALYADGNLVGTRRSGSDGTFDFGPVPAGRGEIETFENQTGQSGVQVFFQIRPDQVNAVNLVMRDQRGVVQGFVYKKVAGADVPMFGVIVWAEGTPFKTVTDAQGRYVLEGVFAGTRNISAADLDKKVKLSETVTIGSEGQVVDRDFYFQGENPLSGIAGEVLGFDGTPVPGATVHLAADDQHWYRTATTNSSGRFTIPDLGVGSYGVHAFKGTSGGTVGATIRFLGDTPFVTIRFKRGQIHGLVQAENDSGQPIGITALVTYRTTAVRLELVGLDLESHTLTTNSDGTYVIPNVLTGPYVLTVSNAFYGSKTVRGELVENGEDHEANFLFERNLTGTIRGRVLDHDGVTPVQGAHVELKHPAMLNDIDTDAEGRFSFALVPPAGPAFPIDVTWEDGVIFRKAEAWVRFNQRGQELDLEIVLPKQGSVSGRVSDANGNLVPGSVVTLQESAYPHRTLIVNADADGNFEFHNIFAGLVTLSARAPALGGLGGKTTAEIKADGEDVAGITIFLEPTGKIQGRITNPGDGSPAASAEVRLSRWGRLFDTINSDSDGRFEFNLLPMGDYDVTALDPRTGRHGRRDGLHLGENNQVLAADFQLEARGAVDGHLYEPASTVAIPGATVRLSAYSIAGFTTYSSTGADGYFEFLGIPQGQFELFSREPGGRRVASGRGSITDEGQRVSVDLFLERQGTIHGSVLNPLGAPDGVFPNANTLLQQDGQTIGATLDSEYQFPGVILGHSFRLRTQEVGGPHQGETWGQLSDTAPAQVDVRMRPIGSVVVDVHDSFGVPVSSANVEVINNGFYGYKRFLGGTGADNSITFQDLGEGGVTAFATNPATGLRGSASAVLTHDGEIVHLDVRLENSGQIQGHVVLADGSTPAVDALVALQIAGRTLTTFTGSDGAFVLPSIPMGGFLLVFQESFGPGMREIRGGLSTNGQVLDLGTVVLDAVNPRVAEITPVNGAVDVTLGTQPVVRFSEAMDPTRNLVNNVVHLETSTSGWVCANNTWIDGNTAIRIVPCGGALQNFTTYRVKVSADQLYDVAGRRLDQSVQTSFTTADVVPPAVIEVRPANNAKQVPLSTQIRIMFSEPVDELSLSGSHMLLQDVTAGTGVTTTFQLDTAGRTVTITPVEALVDGDAYRLTLQSISDRVGNVTTVPFVTTFYTIDTTPPVISGIVPVEGAGFTSGDRMTVSATVADPAGVTSVALRIGRWVLIDTQAPYSWNVPAPVVAAAADVPLEIEAVDAWGNHRAAVRTVHVQPRSNTHPPQIEIGCLAKQVVPGADLDIPLHLTDDEGIESYKLTVGTTTLAEVVLADSADVTATQAWTVPATAAPGSTLTLHLEARDFAGNVTTAETPLTVVAGTPLKGDQALADAYSGQTLYLGKGTFTLSGPLHVGGLVLQRGTVLKPAAAGTVATVLATGRVEVACTARIDVAGLGYAGGKSGSWPGAAPAGVAAAQPDAGGSHGGAGGLGTTAGPAGAVYDSVYQPSLAGGGGALRTGLTLQKGGAGGGVVSIDAAELELAGEIRAWGETRPPNEGGGGAGGTVTVRVSTLKGTGTIEAGGGSVGACSESAGAGGGGRVSLRVQTLDGFDPAAQARAWGGERSRCNDAQRWYAPAGTVYVSDSASTYGRLAVDNGAVSGSGADRPAAATELPALGGGAVAGFSVTGADAWLSAASPFAGHWLGAWVVLKDAAGAPLGSGFKVVEVDGSRVRLAGAAGVTGAASFAGEYRFDAVELRHGAGVRSSSPLTVQDVVIQGDTRLAGELVAQTLRLKAGALVRPEAGSTLRFKVAGRMTVEAGAKIDVSNLGYAGGLPNAWAGGAPAGVAAAQPDAGGSHGGAGSLGMTAGPAGAVYDSVYEPSFAGGGGALATDHLLQAAGAGGGAVTIDAGELELAGQILARGETRPPNHGGGGAGGTVSVRAGTLLGDGTIDASGGDAGACNQTAGTGGGGRVSLRVATLQGFDPAAQVKAWSGERTMCNDGRRWYGAPGTIFVSDSGSTYGRLLVDSGQAGAADRTGGTTELPVLGNGAVTAAEAAGADLWITAAQAFRPEWQGAWVALKDAAGAPLGAGFKVAAVDGTRLRLAGAGSVTGAATFAGEYRFDAIDLRHGAGVRSDSPVVGQQVVLQGAATVAGDITAATVLVKAGAVVTPAAGGTLRFKVTGKMTVEAGARLDVSGLGYAGGTAAAHAGGAPSGVVASQNDAGGSHGGAGSLGTTSGPVGAVYDSVYQPSLAGGGGSLRNDLTLQKGAPGGGVVVIDAGELELAGEIRARGETRPPNEGGGGAGGTVLVRAQTLSGAGTIDTSGGDAGACSQTAGVGGGGRVSLQVQTFSGFDAAAQVKAWSGERTMCNDGRRWYGAPGTIYLSDSTSTYGRLLVDSGQVGSTDRTGSTTELPLLGSGAVTAAATAGSDLWVTAASAFPPHWLGAWVTLKDGTGAALGTGFRVAEIDGARIRLAGAATAVTALPAATFAGEYRFDGIDLRHGAGVRSDSPIAGQQVVLQGAATVAGDITAATVLVKAGAVVTPAAGGTLRFKVTGKMTVEAGARLDVSGLGYAGGTAAAHAGGAPAGVVASQNDAGGSHGGAGSLGMTSGPVGAVYDSVYQPSLGGGGGGLRNDLTLQKGAPGGGVVVIDAGELELAGEIRARGETRPPNEGGGGAGGTVLVRAQTLSGAGTIDTSGGDAGACSQTAGVGGGGRVSLQVQTFSGFDAAAQVKAWSGERTMCNDGRRWYGAPGTVYVSDSTSTYGRLLVDSGQVGSTDRTGSTTELPLLGSGAVTAAATAGSDLWVTAASVFGPEWLGAWVTLKNVSGTALGAGFRVAEIDGSRVRLAGAAATAATAATFAGEYRFDNVDLRHGAGLRSSSPIVGQQVVLQGNATVAGDVSAVNVLVKAGAVVTPAAGGTLRFKVAGRMTIEAGARLDVSGLGYAGGTAALHAGGTPSGVAAPQNDAGGSHGGAGSLGMTSGPVGAVYDSVYQPSLAGGGGSLRNDLTLQKGAAGGGVVTIDAGELELAGEIRARGETRPPNEGGGGAGGTVLVRAGTLLGAGTIDTSGGDAGACSQTAGVGGGGRVSLQVQTLSGFDPAAQVKAWSGERTMCNDGRRWYGAPGTVYVSDSASTYGRLLVDSGRVGSTDRAGSATELPALAGGAVTAVEVAGGDLWVSAASAFGAEWWGAWVQLKDAAGAPLGTGFKVAEVAGGRLRLAGAGAVPGAAAYAGEYRFDAVDLRHGAGVRSDAPITGQQVVLQDAATLAGDLSAASVLVKTGAVVTPATGSTLRLKVSGRLTIESGARLDVTGTGYAGGTGASHPGGAPAGTAASQNDAGGTHGGAGSLGVTSGPAGAVYDSVYEPALAGGGASLRSDLSSQKGGTGGGVVDIDAGELEVAGEIRARGETRPINEGGGGGGGTVAVRAGTLLGAGLIDASGGDAGGCNQTAGVGGGGRVSLRVQTFQGFDPATQVRVWSGERTVCNDGRRWYGAAGTLYVFDSISTYGRLILDAGTIAGTGADRAGLPTELPALGTGAVTAFAAAGSDAWMSAASPFGREWQGAWVNLKDAAGAAVGSGYRVVEIDGVRLRLAGAGALTGAASYAGEYRFDALDVRHGAGLRSASPVAVQDATLANGAAVSAALVPVNLTVKAGAVVKPATGNELRLAATGRLTVEAGALLDVSGLGYAGGTGSHPDGFAPAGVTPAKTRAGGSHGGRGGLSTAGEVYDSVSLPQLAGGGGAYQSSAAGGGPGGGLIFLTAGELVLAGDVKALGSSYCGDGVGAGGTVSIAAGVVSGAGTIDASGGDVTCNIGVATGGGGGRVAIATGTWNGFNPAAQVKAWGGGDWPRGSFAAPGTIFYRKTGDTYGALLVDAGEFNSADRVSLATELPVLGSGAVTAASASGSDLWVSTAAPGFAVKWLGAWMRLASAAGADLGSFQVAEIDVAGRARLAGASAATAAATWTGEYRYDRVELKNGAGLDARDPLASTDTVFASGDAELVGTVTGATAEVLAGSVVRPARGSELRLSLTGKLTVEATGRLDVTGTGYVGGTGGHPDGFAPSGVTPSKSRAGGSHGGRGGLSTAGEIYDGLYAPQLAGGGGAYQGSTAGGSAGGGTVFITASEVALAGEIRAQGAPICGDGAGAGGTVSITAGVVSGAGLVDASGGDVTCNTGAANGGGGGRVAVVTGAWSGFDPLTQLRAAGGGDFPRSNFAAAGTVYTKKAGDTYGSLLVDQVRTSSNSVGTTLPPSIGKGTVGAVAAEPGSATALWIEPQDPARLFDLGVVGMWVRIQGTDYPVIGQSADRRRLLLAGAAGAVSVGDAYLGLYKLDAVTVKGRASLQFQDGAVIGSSTVAGGSALTLYDLTPPVVTITQPAAGTLYTPGQTMQASAQVTDDRAVASVTFRLLDQSFVDTAVPYDWSVAVPSVETEADYPVTVEAVDTNDNHTTATRLVHIRPLAPGAAPAVAFTCPTPGVLLAPGTGIDLNVAASHDNGIERVELLQGSTLLSTDLQAPYAFRFTVPAGTADGTVITLTARAKSFTGTTATTTIDLKVVQGTVITADRTVTAADTSLDNTSVVVAGGTLTVTGAHTFRDLAVLDGAKLTHPETTSTQEQKLDLTVTRDVYVACTGAVDVAGRGFLGGAAPGQRAYGFGNVTTEGASGVSGGSHGGRAGAYDGTSPVYGSFYDPRDSGAGGAYVNGKGRDGGGIVRLTATGNAVIDGAVTANGEAGATGAGGAGGSIRINAAAIRGAGSITASGSPGIGGTAGAGSGGRIALYAASVDSGLLGRTLAAGGKTSATDASTWGAAGTVFVKPDAQALGDLVLDNAGTASTQYTELPTVGHGVVDAVSANGFTDNEADFRWFLGAAEVAFNGDFNTLYTILNHGHHGTSLTLAVPAPPLSNSVHAGDTYDGLYRFHSVVVRNGAQGIALDPVTTGNTPGTGWTQGYAPSVQITSPAAGATLTSGNNFNVAAAIQDVLGVKSVTFTFNGQTSTVTASPYTWATAAPQVFQTADFPVTASVVDLSGNRFSTAITVHVQPIFDPVPPVVTLGACPADNDYVTPGAALTLPFAITDDKSIQSYSLVVDGTTLQTVTANAAAVTSSFTWTPPANAALGTSFAVRIEARDFGGSVGSATWTLKVPPVAALTGTQSLTTARNGQDLYLGAGTFTVQQAISPASLTLLSGAKVVGLSGQTLSLAVAGAVRVQCGGLLDVSNLGYLGGPSSNTAGSAPSGVTPSAVDAGGSHGGYGAIGGYAAGPAGDVFDNVYLPAQGGGGGSLRICCGLIGGAGGGTLSLSASSVVLNGEIRARGEKRQTNGQSDSSGAGGSVQITAAAMSGVGLIDASGADYQAVNYNGGSGGGGRIALWVDSLSGFDPVSQAKVWGGTVYNGGTTVLRYAGPGTVFVKTASDVYGRLIVDAGKESNGAERVGPQTPLTTLGTGTVTAFAAQGSDALVSTGAGFQARWKGAWMLLDDAAGNNLGAFKVLSLDGSNRALLQGAAGAATAAKFRGQYRFDRLDVKGGAGVSSSDDLVVTDVFAESKGRLPASLTATNLTVKAGSPVALAVGGDLKLALAGRLTVEPGAVLDVSSKGFLGAQTNNAAGSAPSGVTPSGVDAGGSHGGSGALGGYSTGPVGDVFDSVYRPLLGGGGGSQRICCSIIGGAGGGTVSVTAAEVVLDGEIRAKGEKRQVNGQTDSSGAGGSVLITAASMSGAGLIDASGADYQAVNYNGGSGGGGRVALYVGTLSGFDPVAQVKTWGGTVYNGSSVLRYAGPGTVLVRTSGQTYGRLIVDAGKESNGAERIGPQTPLPGLGTGTVTAVAVQGQDALVTASAAFKAPWTGAWMVLSDANGAALGSFEVLSIDAQGRALLKGAATATAAASYRGQYRFDRLDVKGGAGVSSADELVVTDAYAESKGRLPSALTATNLTVKAGSPVSLAVGGNLKLTLAGRLTVESGAVLDVTAGGYLGAQTNNAAGSAPSGVTPSGVDAGGSHGGSGALGGYSTGPVGDVFDSVYRPLLGGGGGSLRICCGLIAGAGGGTVSVTAGEVVLDGEIRAKGEKRQVNGQSDSSGAGGSVMITAASMSGAGLIDASGADYQAVNYNGGSGGGGRVALYVDAFTGFDPAAQVKAWGGTVYNGGTSVLRYAGPGTVLIRTSGQSYGRLIVDAGKESNGAERVGPQTPLPGLGTGTVTALTVQGQDALVAAAAAFKAPWLGAWMALDDATGASLGSFQVLSIDTQGRVLLKGAATATAATRYRGQYRFDRVDVKGGAGVSSADEVIVGDLIAESKGRIPATFTAANVTIKTGSPVTPAVGGDLKLTVSGRMTVETGAVLDVTARGYLGAQTNNAAGSAPSGVTASAVDAGGSHGGVGAVGGYAAGPAGEVYGNVYGPRLGGGGGSLRICCGLIAGAGGGTIALNVNELVLDGEIRAKGEKRQVNGQSDSSGAGGSVLITATTMSGAGLIDASGADYQAVNYHGGSGGGGRVALYVDTLTGFSPATQVRVRGGAVFNNTAVLRWASPGTAYLKQPQMTYGKLYVGQGGTSAMPIPNTPLPAIGVGTIGTVTTDSVVTTAAWIEPSDPTAKFALGVIGMWVRVGGTDYPVLDQSADRRRLLLAGAAGAVSTGAGYRGVYKFDEVIVSGGSKLEFRDTNVVTTFTVDGTSSVIQNVP